MSVPVVVIMLYMRVVLSVIGVDISSCCLWNSSGVYRVVPLTVLVNMLFNWPVCVSVRWVWIWEVVCRWKGVCWLVIWGRVFVCEGFVLFVVVCVVKKVFVVGCGGGSVRVQGCGQKGWVMVMVPVSCFAASRLVSTVTVLGVLLRVPPLLSMNEYTRDTVWVHLSLVVQSDGLWKM